jgi:thiamine-monophosphate kinase
MKEDVFLEIIKEALPESEGYIGDDTVYLPRKDTILTQDTLVENVHFKRSTISPYYLGRKSIAVNLSDIAAAGGNPAHVMISLSLPENTREKFVEEFYRGVHDICKEYDVVVIGGDLTRASEIMVSICAIGFGAGLIPASRKNAKVGDIVIVTGNFGSSRAGLEILENYETYTHTLPKDIRKKFVEAHINPVPRVKEARVLLRMAKKMTMMDASDGLADALYKICVNSDVGMTIDFNDVPFDKDMGFVTENELKIIKWILFGGEDYELVATVSPQIYQRYLDNNVPIKKIGTVIPVYGGSPCPFIETKNKILKIDSAVLKKELYSHFEG